MTTPDHGGWCAPADIIYAELPPVPMIRVPGGRWERLAIVLRLRKPRYRIDTIDLHGVPATGYRCHTEQLNWLRLAVG